MMRALIVLVTLALASLAAAPAQALNDNLYFTVAQNSSACFDVSLPLDLDTLETDYYIINVSTDFPMNLKFINTSAAAGNIVKVPLCFISRGMDEGDFAYYKILSHSGRHARRWSGGVCVSEISDVDYIPGGPSGDESPCDLINGNEDLFYIGFLQPVKWAPTGSELNYTIMVRSMENITLELSAEGLEYRFSRRIVETSSTGKLETVDLTVGVPAKYGRYPLTVRARMKFKGEYCYLPFCMRETNATLLAGALGGMGWSATLFPGYISSSSAKPIPYTAVIRNQEEEDVFEASLELPAGFETDWIPRSAVIGRGEYEMFNFTVTPPDEIKTHEITLKVTAGGEEREYKSYLSVRGIEGDVKREWNSLRNNVSDSRLRSEIEQRVSQFLSQQGKGFGLEEYMSIKNLLSSARSGDGVSPPTGDNRTVAPPTEWDPLQIVFILVPIAVILVLILLFFRKSIKTAEIRP